MKEALFILIAIFSLLNIQAQSSLGFKYQAVARDNEGDPYVNKTISLRISILEESFNGNSVYVEVHKYTTNEYGLINIVIGRGESELGSFKDIDWSSNEFFLKTELDLDNTGNYFFLGSSQLLSVPFAKHAETATNVDDADADPNNEIQELSINGTTLSLKDGGEVEIDSDPSNEIQTLSMDGVILSLTDGGDVDLSHLSDDDSDSTNELQALSLSNDTLRLSNGNYVVLTDYLDNTDKQTLSLVGNELRISNGNGVMLSGTIDLDADPTNELQNLSSDKDSIYLSDGGAVHWLDNDSTNELQSMSSNKDSIYLSDGGAVQWLDNDSMNEIQHLSINGDTITLSDDTSIILNHYKQSLSIKDDSISISEGNTIKLPSNFPIGSLVFSELSNDTNLISLGFELIGVEQRNVASINENTSLKNDFYLVNSEYMYEFDFTVDKENKPIYFDGKIYLYGAVIDQDTNYYYNYIIDIETKEVSLMDTTSIRMPIVEGFESVLVGDEIFYWGGSSTINGSQSLWNGMIYNIPNDSFRLVSSEHGLNTSYSWEGHSLSVIGSKVIVLGGTIGNGGESEGFIYDIENDSWSDISNYPISGGVFDHTAIVVDSLLYVFGGRVAPNTYQGSFLVYNFINDSWTNLSLLGFSAGFYENKPTLVGDNIIVFSGLSSSSSYSGSVYSITNDTWTSMSNSSQFNYKYNCSILAIDSVNALIYGGTAFHVSAISDQTDIYNVNENSWSFSEPFFQNDNSDYSYGELFHHNEMFCFVNVSGNVSISCIKKEQLHAEKDTEIGYGRTPLTRTRWYYIYKKVN